jgi:hypothetical protein
MELYIATTKINKKEGDCDLKSKKQGVIPLAEFVDEKGTRFNVFATKPSYIFISCQEGSYEGSF